MEELLQVGNTSMGRLRGGAGRLALHTGQTQFPSVPPRALIRLSTQEKGTLPTAGQGGVLAW
jgi:hypothetical protein